MLDAERCRIATDLAGRYMPTAQARTQRPAVGGIVEDHSADLIGRFANRHFETDIHIAEHIPSVVLCVAMRIETAQSLAATAQEGITVTQVKSVIDAFLDAVSRCPTCDRSGVFIFGRNTAIDAAAFANEVPAGTRSTCPSCGDPASHLDSTPGDREFFGWHCFRGDSVATCHTRREGDDPAHVTCGDRVLLPLPGTATHDVPRLLDSAR